MGFAQALQEAPRSSTVPCEGVLDSGAPCLKMPTQYHRPAQAWLCMERCYERATKANRELRDLQAKERMGAPVLKEPRMRWK